LNNGNAIEAICLLLTMKLENYWALLNHDIKDVSDEEKYRMAHKTFMKLVGELKLLDEETKKSIWYAYGPSLRDCPSLLD